MAETPAPAVEAKPTTPFGIAPWMFAAALGIGAGVVIGLRLAQMMRPPNLPPRACAECDERHKAEALEVLARHMAPPSTMVAPPVVPRPDPTSQFSAQDLPDDDDA